MSEQNKPWWFPYRPYHIMLAVLWAYNSTRPFAFFKCYFSTLISRSWRTRTPLPFLLYFPKPAMPSSLTHIVKLNKFLIHWLVKMGICFWMQHLMQIPHIKEWNIRNHSCICKTLENDSLNLNLPSPIYSQKAQISQKQQVSPASTPAGKPTLTEFLATRSVDLKNYCKVQLVFWEM